MSKSFVSPGYAGPRLAVALDGEERAALYLLRNGWWIYLLAASPQFSVSIAGLAYYFLRPDTAADWSRLSSETIVLVCSVGMLLRWFLPILMLWAFFAKSSRSRGLGFPLVLLIHVGTVVFLDWTDFWYRVMD